MRQYNMTVNFGSANTADQLPDLLNSQLTVIGPGEHRVATKIVTILALEGKIILDGFQPMCF